MPPGRENVGSMYCVCLQILSAVDILKSADSMVGSEMYPCTLQRIVYFHNRTAVLILLTVAQC